MSTTNYVPARLVSIGLSLVLALGAMPSAAMTSPGQQSGTDLPPSAPQAGQAAPPAPDKSGSTGNAPAGQASAEQLPDSPNAEHSQSANAGSPQAASPSPQSVMQRPVGTAAAGIGNTSGIAASSPAGVAIAPAKQHQARSLLLKVGAVIGAGVAVGTVAALSKASPSKPPGAR